MMNASTPSWRRVHGISIDWLISFIAVVDHRGFGKAAEALHKSQSRISDHVQQLERHVRAELLDRTQRPVQLTDAGEVFLPYARESLSRLSAGAGHVASVAALEHGEVRIGSYASVSTSFLPKVLADFSQAYPDVRLTLHELGVPELDAALLMDHVGLMIRPAFPEIEDERISTHTLWSEPVLVVMPSGQTGVRPGAEDGDPLDALHDARVISVGISRSPDQLSTVHLDTDTVLSRAGVDLSDVLYTQHPQALVEFVRAGLGVGVANYLALAASDTAGLTMLPVAGVFRDVIVCWHSERYLAQAERRFLDCILQAELPPGVLPPPSSIRSE